MCNFGPCQAADEPHAEYLPRLVVFNGRYPRRDFSFLLGDLLSVAASVVATRLMGENLSVSPTLAAVAAAFGISVGIGVLFGYLPARRAARLNPIEALRYD